MMTYGQERDITSLIGQIFQVLVESPRKILIKQWNLKSLSYDLEVVNSKM